MTAGEWIALVGCSTAVSSAVAGIFYRLVMGEVKNIINEKEDQRQLREIEQLRRENELLRAHVSQTK